MAKIRNVSGERRFVPELGRAVEDDELFDVSSERVPAFEAQPYFRRDGRRVAKDQSRTGNQGW